MPLEHSHHLAAHKIVEANDTHIDSCMYYLIEICSNRGEDATDSQYLAIRG